MDGGVFWGIDQWRDGWMYVVHVWIAQRCEQKETSPTMRQGRLKCW